MKYQSLSWLASINHILRDSEKQPVFPSIASAAPPCIIRLFERIGIPRTLEAEEPLFSPGSPVNCLVLIRKGVTARAIGSETNKTMAISIPGRIACGNLNFFTGRSCMGNYFAIVPSEVLYIRRELLLGIVENDAELLLHFVKTAELCALSDRMAFAALTLLPVESRLKAFYLAWAANYARYRREPNGEGWLVMPPSLPRKYLCYLVNSSRCSLDEILKKWKASAKFSWSRSEVKIRPSLLQESWQWMREIEEPSAFRRPKEPAVAALES
jgi:hypothetical protein